MGIIFISYRREDAQASAGRLYDRLKETFGKENVFMDVETIAYGDDFVQAIRQGVSQCRVLIAVIGRQWITITNSKGHRRLDDPQDFVRVELETALQGKIRVIPVLVDNAPLPSAGELPAELQPLLHHNAVYLRHDRFDDDVQRLSDSLRNAISGKRRFLRRLTAILLITIAALGIFLWMRKTEQQSTQDPFMVKIRLNSRDRPTQSFNEGYINVYIGREFKRSDIRHGEAAVFNIPAQFDQRRARIELEVPGFQIRDTAIVLLSSTSDYIDLPVMRSPASLRTTIRGSVLNEKNIPVRHALIDVGSGIATCYTDLQGDFSVTVPLPAGERTRMKILVDNITRYSEDVVLSAASPIQVKIDMHR